jgi:hypothetical protein
MYSRIYGRRVPLGDPVRSYDSESYYIQELVGDLRLLIYVEDL